MRTTQLFPDLHWLAQGTVFPLKSQEDARFLTGDGQALTAVPGLPGAAEIGGGVALPEGKAAIALLDGTVGLWARGPDRGPEKSYGLEKSVGLPFAVAPRASVYHREGSIVVVSNGARTVDMARIDLVSFEVTDVAQPLRTLTRRTELLRRVEIGGGRTAVVSEFHDPKAVDSAEPECPCPSGAWTTEDLLFGSALGTPLSLNLGWMAMSQAPTDRVLGLVGSGTEPARLAIHTGQELRTYEGETLIDVWPRAPICPRVESSHVWSLGQAYGWTMYVRHFGEKQSVRIEVVGNGPVFLMHDGCAAARVVGDRYEYVAVRSQQSASAPALVRELARAFASESEGGWVAAQAGVEIEVVPD